MSEDLKPCPFCGSSDTNENDQGGIAWVGCNDCGTEGPTTDMLWEAIELWNRRNPSTPGSNHPTC